MNKITSDLNQENYEDKGIIYDLYYIIKEKK